MQAWRGRRHVQMETDLPQAPASDRVDITLRVPDGFPSAQQPDAIRRALARHYGAEVDGVAGTGNDVRSFPALVGALENQGHKLEVEEPTLNNIGGRQVALLTFHLASMNQ